jgi:hypothetical protein
MPPTVDAHRREFLVHALLFLALAATLALQSPGAYNDDDLDHYFMAKAAFRHPEFFVDYWGRMGFTVPYALIAQLGWNATRFATIFLTLLTGFVTFRTAETLGARRPGAWSALALWQPMVLLLSFSVLTEPLAALLVAVVLNRQAADKPLAAALAAGFLPTVRVELGVLTLVVAGWILWRHRGRWPLLVLLGLPFLGWTVIAGLMHHDPLWLLNEIRTKGRPLGTSGPVHYFRNLVVVTGSIGLFGLVLGGWRVVTGRAPRLRFAGVVWLVGFAVLTLLTWEAFTFGSSVGFLRHLIVLAPAGALLAGAGFEWAVAGERRDRPAVTVLVLGFVALVALVLSHRLLNDTAIVPGRDWRRLTPLVPAALLVLWAAWRRGTDRPLGALPVLALVGALIVTRPIPLTVEQRVVRQAADALRTKGMLDRPLLASHPWFYLFTDRDRWDRARTGYTTRAAMAAAPPGALALWDNHYGHRLFGDVTWEELRADPAWKRLEVFEDPETRFVAILFEKRP